MSMPTFYTYFNAASECIGRGNNAMFSWRVPRTDNEIKNEALGALFKIAALAGAGERTLEHMQEITQVGINSDSPTCTVDELAKYVRSGNYKIGHTRNYGDGYKDKHPDGDPVRDVIAPIFPQFRVKE